jgi:hypothetical protein
LSQVQLSAEQVRNKATAELTDLEVIKAEFTAARRALHSYQQTLHARYGALLKLRVYAVVSLGFERLFWQEITAP